MYIKNHYKYNLFKYLFISDCIYSSFAYLRNIGFNILALVFFVRVVLRILVKFLTFS